MTDAQDELVKLRAQVGIIDDSERQIRNLQNEISILSGKRDYVNGYDRLTKITRICYQQSCYLHRTFMLTNLVH